MKHLADIGGFLIDQRKQRQLSQQDMQMKIGMQQQQYQRVEAGSDLKVSTLMRILAGMQQELVVVPSNKVREVHAFIEGNWQNDPDQIGEIGADDPWTAAQKHLED